MDTLPAGFTPILQPRPSAWGGAVGKGRIRVSAEDFRVWEVPLVTPDGAGEHCWLRVRKRDCNTAWVARQLAAFAEVSPAAVGYAGMKDRRAVTEQWFSLHLPGKPDPDWSRLENADFEVLEHRRHGRKLKTGALAGNRFAIRIRELECDATALAQRLRRLGEAGMPNYFGDQRFGIDGGNLVAAAQIFSRPRRRLARAKRGIYLSAVRSALFNVVLGVRVQAGTWNQVLAGEALQLEGRSACFVTETPDAQTLQRLQTLAVHPTGPLCGDGESLPRAAALACETESLDAFAGWIKGLREARVNAARRALRAVPRELHWHWEAPDCALVSFYLPAGSYATSLLAELVSVSVAA